jgi:hypothetical protein
MKILKATSLLIPILLSGCVIGGQVPIKIIGFIFIIAAAGIVWWGHLLAKDGKRMQKPLTDEYQSERIGAAVNRGIGFFFIYLIAAILIAAGLA